MFEIGPLFFYTNSSGVYFRPNNFTWALEYNLLFIDNPIGYGYSFINNA